MAGKSPVDKGSSPGTSPEVVIYAEFITNLKVANIYVGFKEACTSFFIRKIVCEPRHIQLSLRPSLTGSNCLQPATDDWVYCLALPNDVSVLPDTCTALQATPYGWLLRLSIKETQDRKSDYTSYKLNHQQPFQPKCAACGQSFFMPAFADCITNCIPISRLGLPPGFSFEAMDLTYFCHDHGCCGENNAGEGYGQPNKEKQAAAVLAPKLNEVFHCDTHYLLNGDCLGKCFAKLKDGELRCSRCHLVIGETGPNLVNEVIKLYVDGVHLAETQNAILETLLKESITKCRRLCIYVQAQHWEEEKFGDTALMLVWIMDRNLKTYNAQSTGQTFKSRTQDVCKVLYKQEKSESVLGKQWLTDSNVNKILVHQSLFVNLISALLKSTQNLPLAWRYSNCFCIGYLETCA